MNYLINQVTTAEDCDLLLQKAGTEQRVLTLKSLQQTLEYETIFGGAVNVGADLTAVTAEISGLEIAIASMNPSLSRSLLENKLVKLIHKKFLLAERKTRYGIIGILEQQYVINSIEKQQLEVEAFIAAINQRKAEIG